MRTGWLPWSAVLIGCGAAPEPNEQRENGPTPPAAQVVQRERAGEPLPVEADGQAMAGAGAPNSLCQPGEVVIFQCSLGRKTVAVCGGRSPSGRIYAQYRYGVPGRLELVHPSRTDGGAGGLSRAFTGYSGGGENQLRFSSRGVDYVVYGRMVRTGFGPDGHNNPAVESGVAVVRANRLLSDLRCVDPPDAWVDEQQAPRFMPEGESLSWADIEMPRP